MARAPPLGLQPGYSGEKRGTSMHGIMFKGNCTLELVTVPDPTPGPGEVVLEIKASGMCGSDLHFYRRPLESPPPPVIAGHEPSGVVVAVGPGVTSPHARLGERVMQHHYRGCTDCQYCRSGWPQLCRALPGTLCGTAAHGRHAPPRKLSAHTPVTLPARLSFA